MFALAAIGAAAAFLVYAVAFPSAEKTAQRQMMAALQQCQNAIQKTALYGNSEAPPYTPNHGKGDEFYFAWAPGSFSFTNAFGGQIKMSASCTGVVSTGKIGHLTVNGKDIE